MRGFVLSSLNQHAFTAVTTYIALIVEYSFHLVVIHRLGKNSDLYHVVCSYSVSNTSVCSHYFLQFLLNICSVTRCHTRSSFKVETCRCRPVVDDVPYRQEK